MNQPVDDVADNVPPTTIMGMPVEVLRVLKGDVVIISVPRHTNPDAAARAARVMEQALAAAGHSRDEVHVIVVMDGIRVGKFSGEELDELVRDKVQETLREVLEK